MVTGCLVNVDVAGTVVCGGFAAQIVDVRIVVIVGTLLTVVIDVADAVELTMD